METPTLTLGHRSLHQLRSALERSLGVQAAPITELPSPEGTASGPRLCGQYRLSSGEDMSGAALRLDEARSFIEEVRTVPCD